jgi:hypothetical protein
VDRDAEFHFSNLGAGLSIIVGIVILFSGFAALAILHGQLGMLVVTLTVIPCILILTTVFGRGQIDATGVTWRPLWGATRRIDWQNVQRIRWSPLLFAVSDGRRSIQIAWQDTPAPNRGPAEWLVRYALRDFDLKPAPNPPPSLRRVLIILLPTLGGILFAYAWLVRSLHGAQNTRAIPALVLLVAIIYPMAVFAVEAFNQRHLPSSPFGWRTRAA